MATFGGAMGVPHVPNFMGAEGRACVDRVEGQVQRPWDLWKSRAAQRRSA